MAKFSTAPGYSEQLITATMIAMDIHKAQLRHDGSMYITHLFRVAALLMSAGASEQQIIAGLLHDSVEDVAYPLERIGLLFGITVKSMVAALTKPNDPDPLKDNEGYASQVAACPESILVSCADKLDNLRGYLVGGAVFKDKHRHLYSLMMPIYKRHLGDESPWVIEMEGMLMALSEGAEV